MPKNKKESLVLTTMMCTLMVFFMSMYNVARLHGIGENYMKMVLIGLPLGFIVAFAAEWFLVGPVAKGVTFKLVKENDGVFKKIVILSTCTIIGMVFVMSLYGAIIGVGLSDKTFMAWMVNIPMNFIVAFPLQLIIVGPVVRKCFGMMFRTV